MNSQRLRAIAEEVARTIENHQLAESNDRILVAFSGGADSTAMTILLAELGFELVLGHVDHGIRPDSYLDVEHCARTAAKLELEFVTERITVQPATEANARRYRYEALERFLRAKGATLVATGHTKDDQAETVVMRMRRGGFPLGIPYRRGLVIRPILDVRRRVTEEVCRLAGLEYLVDPTNYDLSYERNVVRHSVLVRVDDPEIDRLAEAAGESRARIDSLDEGFIQGLSDGDVVITPGRAEVRREFLTHSSRELRRHVLARALESVSLEPSGALLRDIEEKVVGKTGSRLELGGARSVRSTRDWLIFGTDPEEKSLRPFEVGVPGSAASSEWGFVVKVEESAPEPVDGVWEQVFSGDAIPSGARLIVRQWKPGDRFHPLGAAGTKKLQDFFVDSGVPRHERSGVPIIEYGDRIVWIVGMRIDDRFKITDSTARGLRISVFPTLQREDPARSITDPS